MTRWLQGYLGHRATIKRISDRILLEDIVPTPLQGHFSWPDISVLRKAQKQYVDNKPELAISNSDGLITVNNRLGIPDDASDLQWKLLITDHCGHAGYRGVDSNIASLNKEFYWSSMKDDAAMFVSNCIH